MSPLGLEAYSTSLEKKVVEQRREIERLELMVTAYEKVVEAQVGLLKAIGGQINGYD